MAEQSAAAAEQGVEDQCKGLATNRFEWQRTGTEWQADDVHGHSAVCTAEELN